MRVLLKFVVFSMISASASAGDGQMPLTIHRATVGAPAGSLLCLRSGGITAGPCWIVKNRAGRTLSRKEIADLSNRAEVGSALLEHESGLSSGLSETSTSGLLGVASKLLGNGPGSGALGATASSRKQTADTLVVAAHREKWQRDAMLLLTVEALNVSVLSSRGLKERHVAPEAVRTRLESTCAKGKAAPHFCEA